MELSEKIRFYRKKQGLTQTELGEKLGIKKNAVSKWETGRTVLPMPKLIALAEIFDVPLSVLLEDDEAEAIDKQSPSNFFSATLEYMRDLGYNAYPEADQADIYLSDLLEDGAAEIDQSWTIYDNSNGKLQRWSDLSFNTAVKTIVSTVKALFSQKDENYLFIIQSLLRLSDSDIRSLSRQIQGLLENDN